MQKSELKILKENISLLLKCIDPQTKLQFKEDTILKSDFNKKILADVCEVIDMAVKFTVDPKKVDRRYKTDFFISKDCSAKIQLSDDPIPISKFTHILNEQVEDSFIKKLRAVQVTSWLYQEGYLSEIVHEDGKKFKILTEKSNLIGLSSVEMTNSIGRKYPVILYDQKAQKFVIDNINKIIWNNQIQTNSDFGGKY